MTPERWQDVMHVLDAALSLDTAERVPYLDKVGSTDPELRREVDSLIRSHKQAGSGFLNSPAANLKTSLPEANSSLSRVGRRIGAYNILEEIGRGGMGEVYRAVRADGQFKKAVAIKLVRGGADTAAVLNRFRNERQILASLDHPNIARLLDGGTSDEGIPYLVMELVEGTPLDTYCDSGRLSITQRLRLFRQVCAAVQYAHQRLVIHRDIKPNNILVSQDGTPKLLDFGIAKIVDPASTAESTLGHPMTPEYASPEQIRCETITTATDVYSLGVVLYQLLTGHSPYHVDTQVAHELARAITETDPERPSSVVLRAEEVRGNKEITRGEADDVSVSREGSPAKLQRRLTGDLDNIVLKALRKEPERRYGSVEQLDEDLRRHLEGLPVSARKDSWSYRASKFVERHKAGVAAAAVAVILLVVGVGLILRAERVARKQAEIARAEKARAEKRFGDLRKLSNSMIFEIHDSIQDLPGATPARKLLLDKAVEYLDSLAKDSGGDPDLQRELGWGYQRLAVVQGNTTESNLGDTSAWEASNRKAMDLFEAVAKANPQNAIDQLNVAMEHRILAFGSVLEPNGRQDLDQAMAITDRLMKTDGSNPKVKSERSIEYQDLGIIQNAMGERAQALESLRKYQAMRMDLRKTNPEYHGIQRSVGMSTIQYAEQLGLLGSRHEALEQMQAGTQAFASLTKSDANPDVKRELAVSQIKRALVQLMDGDAPSAETSLQQAAASLQVLAKADPENAMFQSDLSGVDYEQAMILVFRGKYGEGVAKLRAAITKIENKKLPPGVALGDFYIWLGEGQAGMGDTRAALQSYQKAVALLDIPAGRQAFDSSRCESATSYLKLGDILVKSGDLKQAGVAYQKAVDITNPRMSSEQQDVPALYPAADAYAGLGDVAMMQAGTTRVPGESIRLWADARNSYEKSLEIWRSIPNPSRISPIGFAAGDPREVTQRLNECDRQKARLAVKASAQNSVSP
jgi:non-specific serine/threonine protein kinase/serine/threonine-protein kinase